MNGPKVKFSSNDEKLEKYIFCIANFDAKLERCKFRASMVDCSYHHEIFQLSNCADVCGCANNQMYICLLHCLADTKVAQLNSGRGWQSGFRVLNLANPHTYITANIESHCKLCYCIILLYLATEVYKHSLP